MKDDLTTVPLTTLKAFEKALRNCQLKREPNETEGGAQYRRGYNAGIDTALGLLRELTRRRSK